MSKGPKKSKGPTEPLTHMVAAIPLALVSGCLVFLSFPTYDMFPLQWVALVPLLVAVRGRGLQSGLFLGFCTGLVTNVGGFYWISGLLGEFGHMGPIPSVALMLVVASYQAIPNALATGLSAIVARRFGPSAWFLAFPVLFTATEFLVPFIFPWYFANGQQPFHAVTQIVDITGVSGLTFLLVLVNCALAAVVTQRLARQPFPIVRVASAAVVLLASLVYGVMTLRSVDRQVRETRKFRVSMVEADVGIWEKEAQLPDGSPMPWEQQVRMLYGNLLKHQFLTADLEREAKPDLIVWPESSYNPLHAVFARRTDAFAVTAGAGGKASWITARGTRPLPGADTASLSVTGIRGVAAAHEEFIVAVGARGAIHVFNGRTWTREPSGTDRDLFAVAAIPGTGDALAVGAQGTVVLRKGGRWDTQEPGTSVDLKSVTWSGGRSFATCGDQGTLVTLKGRRATLIDTGTTQDLLALSWSDQRGLVVVGREGSALRVEGRRTLKWGTGAMVDFLGVAAGKDTWITGRKGLLLRCREECERIRTGLDEDLVSVSGDGGGKAWAVGARGTVLALSGDAARKVAPLAGHGPLGKQRSVAWVPLREGYPLYQDVRYLYRSPEPLPDVGSAEDPGPAVDADHDTPTRDRNAAIRGFSTPLLMGAITYRDRPGFDSESEYFNTALLVAPDGEVLGRYDKNYLLIFGEYLPFSDWFPFLKTWLPEAGDYRAGETVEVFELDGVRIGLMICYEDIIPSFTRRLADKDPHILVNVTNDAWFGKTSEPYQHLQLATFRAIENRRFLLRSTNTGITAVVDPAGRILQHTSLEEAEVLTADIAVMTGDTLYRQLGDVFAWGCCVLSLLGLVATRLRRGKKA